MQDNYNSQISFGRTREIIDSNFAAVGFDAVGVAVCETLDEPTRRLKKWLADGLHGDMEYMARSADIRGDLSAVMPGARSVVVTLTSYRNTLSQPPGTPAIATFARAGDYHTVIKNRLHSLLEIIRREYPEVKGRAVVDSAPAFEREWAVRAGLGWIGRSSMLVNPVLGSYILIGLLLLDCDVVPSGSKIETACGSCRRCIENCPTGAIISDRQVDARRCLSYQTIERKGAVEKEFVPKLGGRIFGCDRCMEVCPYNINARTDVSGLPGDDFYSPTARQWLSMSEEEFSEKFKGTPLSRAGLAKIVSNLQAWQEFESE